LSNGNMSVRYIHPENFRDPGPPTPHHRTHKEVAARLGITLQAAQQTEARALRKLREGIGEDIFEKANIGDILAAFRKVDWNV